MYTVNIFDKFGLIIGYIKEINNYINLSNECDISPGIYHFSEEELKEIIKENANHQYEKFLRIFNNRKKLKNEAVDEIDNQKYSQYTLNLHPSRTCNLACKYCFGSLDYLPESRPSFEMAKKAIDFLVYEYAPFSKKYIIDLSGSGEPLLQFEFIKKIEEYAEILRNETGKEILVMFVSNLTLLTEEMATYFKKHPYIVMGVSLDGNKELNKNRIKKNGQDAFEDIIKGIKLIAPKNVGIASTVTHNNEKVDEIYDFLYTIKNSDCIGIQQVRDYTDKEISFYKIDQENVIKHYEKLLINIVDHLDKGDDEYLYKILRGADTIGNYISAAANKGVLSQYRCDAGKNRISLDNKGNLYACSVMNGCNEFLLGNIEEGIDKEKQKKFLLPVDKYSETCSKCWAAYICSGECYATAYYTNNDIFSPNIKVCEYRKKIIECAIAFVNWLEENHKDYYKKILEFSLHTNTFFETDLGHWSAFMYLKSQGIQLTYSDMVTELKKGIHGVEPKDLIDYVSKYVEGYDPYDISELDNIDELKLPAIALINKRNVHKYEYYLIKKVVDDDFVVNIGDKQDYLINKKDFIENYSSIVFM